MKKHAYLVIAHNEFEMLQRLISALDRPNHDIYVHIDKKVKHLPDLSSKYSNLDVLKNRRKVYWGDVSQIAVELHLLQYAVDTGIDYGYYHIISGTHYPLMSNDEIDAYFDSTEGKSIVMNLECDETAVDKRLGRYNFFVPLYFHPNLIVRKTGQFLWRALLYAQIKLGIKRDTSHFGGKITNWCSLTRQAAITMVNHKKEILRKFNFTFCADELFVLSVMREYNLEYEVHANYLYQKFVLGNPRAFVENDYNDLVKSGSPFGRKFTHESFSLISKL